MRPTPKRENHPAFISLVMKISYVFIIEKSIALLYPYVIKRADAPIRLQRYDFTVKKEKRNGKS